MIRAQYFAREGQSCSVCVCVRVFGAWEGDKWATLIRGLWARDCEKRPVEQNEEGIDRVPAEVSREARGPTLQ